MVFPSVTSFSAPVTSAFGYVAFTAFITLAGTLSSGIFSSSAALLAIPYTVTLAAVATASKPANTATPKPSP